MLKPCSYIILFVFLLLSDFMVSQASAQEKVDAVNCIIRADNKLVVTHEVLTNKLSVPGGHYNIGESYRAAAERQVWEETGLVVKADKELGRFNNIIFFDCLPKSELLAFYATNNFGGHEFPIWFAPDYGSYSASAMFIDPYGVDSASYRFPLEWKQVRDFFVMASDNQLRFTNDMIESTSKVRQKELKWLSDFQNWFNTLSMSSRDWAILVAIGLMSLAGPTAKLFLFPFIIWRYGHSFTYRVFFAISVCSIIVLIAKQTFTLPRPHVYTPMAELFHSSGFSTPSLSATIWFCILVLFFKKTGKFGNNRYTWLAFLVTVLVMASKFFLATLFMTDILVSAFLGSLIAWHIYRLDDKPNLDVNKVLASKGIWVILTAITLIFTIIWPLPPLKIWLGIFLASALLRIPFKGRELQLSFRKMILSITVLVGTSFLLMYLTSLLTHSHFWPELLLIVHYPLLMLIIMLLAKKPSNS